MKMNTVVLVVSQKWSHPELIRQTLRKLHDQNPECVIRVPDPLSGAAKEAREFCDALGFTIEKYRVDMSWYKYHAEIRNGEMLFGISRNPRNPQQVLAVKPRADLLLAFWSSSSDNVKDVIDRCLRSAEPVVVYREKWKKSKGKEAEFQHVERAETLKRLKIKLTPWRKIDTSRELREAA